MRSTGTVFALRTSVTSGAARDKVPLRMVAAALFVWAGMAEAGIAAEEIRLESTGAHAPVVVRRIVSLDDAALKIRPAAGERGSDGERTIPREELISLVFAPPAPAARETRGTDLLHLTSGDRLRVLSVTSGEDTLSASLAASPATSLTIPLEQTRGLLRLGPRRTDWSARLPVAEGSADVALLQNADRIRGEFLGLSEESLTIDTDAGETKIAREDVKGIAFSPELLSVRPIPVRHAVVQFRDGSYLTVDSVRRGAGETDWQVTTGDARWSIPDESLGRITFYSESATSLLSLTPADRRTVPFLPDEPGDEPANPAAADPSVSPASAASPPPSAPPVVRGRPVPRGLDAQGWTEWTYHLKPGWSELRASANVPDAAGEGGSCVLRIEVDGKAVYESSLVRPGPEPVSIPPIPLTGASTLKLIVDYGEFWDVRNRGVWIDPRLVRTPAEPRKD